MQAVFSGLYIFQDEAARCIGDDRAIRVFIRAVQYDLGVGDDCAAGILDTPLTLPNVDCPSASEGRSEADSRREWERSGDRTSRREAGSSVAVDTIGLYPVRVPRSWPQARGVWMFFESE